MSRSRMNHVNSCSLSIWQPFLATAGAVILDGGLATELERRGAILDDPLWSAKLLLENPELIRQVHLDYYRAGADVAVSASYQASFEGFARRGLSKSRAADLMRRSIQLAQEARDAFWNEGPTQRVRPLVAASVGSYGAFLADGSEFRGDYGLSAKPLRDWHRPRLEVLANAGADLLACETIPCLAEAEALVRLLEEIPGIPAWLSFSCRDEGHLCHGEPLTEAVALANDCGNVVAVGVNCTAPRYVSGLLASVQSVTKKPLLAYPNSGATWDAVARRWGEDANPWDWARALPAWKKLGASLIGGCCRTTPETIRLLRGALTWDVTA